MEIKVTNLNKIYNSETILNNISFSLNKGEKIGLVGKNGVGKTTLLKILAGVLNQDGNDVIFKKNIKIGYMPQDTNIQTNELVYDYIYRVSKINPLIEKYKINIILEAFDLNFLINKNYKIQNLSSGEKSKVFLISLLLLKPDILLLDEPTNHLDIKTLIWLENFLIKSNFTCIIISHDVIFLDKIINKIFEIDSITKNINISNGKYSDYIERKNILFYKQNEKYNNQQKEINRLKNSAEKKKQSALSGSKFYGTDNDKYIKGYKQEKSAKSAKSAKGIEKRIEQIKLINKPIKEKKVFIKINSRIKGDDRDIIIKDLIIGYPNTNFFSKPINIKICFNERVVILGLNGQGKSTLLKTITSILEPISGSLKIGKSLIIGNFVQEHECLPKEQTVLDFLKIKGKLKEQEVYKIISKFGFNSEKINFKIKNLSPGERAKLLFILFSILSVNVLVLDEPTNHLDIESINALTEIIKNYKGTIIVVSHDRNFLGNFQDASFFIFENKELKKEKNFEKYLNNITLNTKNSILKLIK